MAKAQLEKPTLVLLYGFPGAGKTFFARQLCEEIQAAHVQDGRIRHELFEEPTYDAKENEIVENLMQYMTEEFLHAGISVVYDTNARRFGQRRMLRDLARKNKAEHLLIWLQVDAESAFARVVKRDRRKTDDKYATSLDRTTFDTILGTMQNPGQTEEYIVISGKHTFTTQYHTVKRKLLDKGLLQINLKDSDVAKPGMVNLIPNPRAGRVDPSRRNIIIR